jgi:TPR repeat protein
MKLVDYAAQPFAPKGVLCARFSVVRTAAPVFLNPGLLVRGVSCVRPDRPDVVVTLSYAQRSALDNVPPERQQLIDNFLDSLRFLPSNAALMQQARMAVRSDPPENVVGLLTPVADDGDSEAALFLATCISTAAACRSDFQAARKWLEVAANADKPKRRTTSGRCTTRESARRVTFRKQSSGSRSPPISVTRGLSSTSAFSISRATAAKDIGTAEQWLKRASGNGDKRARAILAAGKYKVVVATTAGGFNPETSREQHRVPLLKAKRGV